MLKDNAPGAQAVSGEMKIDAISKSYGSGTPSSQIVGSMATMNVVLGRYKMIPKEVRDIVRGKYGRTPGPISEELKKLVLKNGEQPITHRPADDIAPQMDKMRADLAAKGYPNASVEDVLSYALFPEVALEYFKKNR